MNKLKPEARTKRKVNISVIVIALTLLIVTGLFTYAYFIATGGGTKEQDVDISSSTVDDLTFSVVGDNNQPKEINLVADITNFGQNGNNISDYVNAKAKLTTANMKNYTANYNYYVYLDISDNNFEYSTTNNKAELLLKVTNPNNNEVTSITGLEQKTVTNGAGESITGFDITTYNGLITIADNYLISATTGAEGTPAVKEDKWKVEIILVNYDENQNANAGKTLNAEVIIQKNKYTLSLAKYIKKLPLVTTGAGLYHHKNLTNSAEDDSYRYAGASTSVNNYVCFGSTASPCPEANLYRIIGAFKNASEEYEVKLIKDTSIGNNYWSGSSSNQSNTWSASTLNTNTLNGTYLTNLTTTWTDKITTHDWKVGGNTSSNIYSQKASTAYKNEIVNPAPGTTSTTGEIEYNAKVGLMYVSDYGFATTLDSWTLNLSGYNNATTKANNWLYITNAYQWTITRSVDTTYYAFLVCSTGIVNDGSHVDSNYGVRPVFYLESQTEYSSGDGSRNNPIRIN